MKSIANFIVVLLLCYSSNALACSCMPALTVKEEILRSDFVFTGTVKAKNKFIIKTYLPGIENLFNDTEFVFEIDALYKGRQMDKTVEVLTGSGGGDCGYMFEIGEKYIVYSRLVFPERLSYEMFEPYYITSICTRTQLYNETEIKGIQRIEKRSR